MFHFGNRNHCQGNNSHAQGFMLSLMTASLKLSMHLANSNEELFKIIAITTVCYKKMHSLCKHIRFMARPGPRSQDPRLRLHLCVHFAGQIDEKTPKYNTT